MASQGSISSDGGEQEATPVKVNPAAEDSLHESDSETQEDEAIAAMKTAKLGPGSKPVNEDSDCSSPSASAFIIMPSSKPQSRQRKKPSALKKYSEEEEIALLKGLAVFWANGRNNKWTEFHNFIKDDLPRDFTKIQISEKIRGLKRKFDTNMCRARVNGGRVDIDDHHESVLFELSKRLWGDESGIPFETGNGKGGGKNGEKKTPLPKSLKKSVPKIRKASGESIDEGEEKPKKQKQTEEFGKKEFESEYPLLCSSFDAFGYPKFARDSCYWIGREKAQELEKKWRELNALELRLEMKKIELTKRDLLNRQCMSK